MLRSQAVLNILFSRSMKLLINTFDKSSTKFVFFGLNISFLQYGKKHKMVKYRNFVNSFVSFHFFKDDGLIHQKRSENLMADFFLFYTITKLHLLFKAQFKLHCHNIEKRNLLSFDPRHIFIIFFFFADKWSNEYATL